MLTRSSQQNSGSFFPTFEPHPCSSDLDAEIQAGDISDCFTNENQERSVMVSYKGNTKYFQIVFT